VEETDLIAEETIKFLDRQNSDLIAGKWVVVKGSKSRDAKSAHFTALVGDAFLETLKNCSFKSFCRLGRTTVKLLDKECSGGSNEHGLISHS